MSPHSVCIVTPGNLASSPRVLKEADALHGAGYRVTAVVCDYSEAWRPFDDEIAGRVSWTVRRVQRSLEERGLNAAGALAARAMAGLGAPVPLPVAANAAGGPIAALRRAACAVPADLYIAHYIAALPAAAAAARRHGALLGFDAEDFHSGEGGETFGMSMVRAVEAATLPSCSHMTAAAPLIGQAYARRYGVVAPATVLNVFPLAMAPERPSPPGPAGSIRAYWFSQTIGLDRGLQAFLQAMARSTARVTLDIRGSNRWGHGDTLLAMARELGIGGQVVLLPTAAPDRMVGLAASYDVGLSLETDVSDNRRFCLTNKIFTYLLAGVPVLMSDTPAQRALAPDLGDAAALVSLADPDGIARVLDRLAEAPALAAAKQTAGRLGRARYNWDVEKDVLVEAVAAALARGR